MSLKIKNTRVPQPYVLLSALAILLVAFTYSYPYLKYSDLIIANTHGDDGLFAYNIVSLDPDRFSQDLISLKTNMSATLMNYGSLFLCQQMGVSLKFLNHMLTIWMFLGLGFVFCIYAIRERWFPPFYSVIMFLLVVLSRFQEWNFAAFGVIATPYAAYVSLPLFWLGLYQITKDQKTGYLFLILGSLIHPSFGAYTVVTLFFYLLFEYGPKIWSKLPLFLIFAAATVAVPMLLLASDYRPVSQQELMTAFRFNQHFYPFTDHFTKSGRAFAFLYLFWIIFPNLKALGKKYRNLVFGSLITTGLLSLAHLSGWVFNSPLLIKLIGLRSITLLIVISLPLMIIFFYDSIRKQKIDLLIMILLIVIWIGFVRSPKGLQLLPVTLLGLTLVLSDKGLTWRSGYSLRDKLQVGGGLIFIMLWVFAFLFDLLNPGILTPRFFLPPATFVTAELITLIFMLLVFLLKYLLKIRINFSRTLFFEIGAIVALVLVLLTALLKTSYQTVQGFNKPYYQDLFKAQDWAREHTQSTDLFLVPGYPWRNISERPAAVAFPVRSYVYVPDQKVKSFDDRILQFYGLEDIYHNSESYLDYSQKLQAAYDGLQESGFKELGELVGATYLVEKRELELPIAYKNETYRIYNLK